MEILTWADKTFHQIPEQDNPAFFANDECVMICIDANEPHMKVVFEIKDQHEQDNTAMGRIVGVERVRALGKFWELEDATTFAEAFASTDEDK